MVLNFTSYLSLLLREADDPIRNKYPRIWFEHTNIHFIRPRPNSPIKLLDYSLTNRGTPQNHVTRLTESVASHGSWLVMLSGIA